MLHVPSLAAYAVLAALVGVESAGVPVPGETSLLAAAVLASRGVLDLWVVIAVAAGAAIAGDNAGYVVGRRGGRWLLARPGRWEEQRRRFLSNGEAFFARHGGKAVFFARWVPWLRVTAALLAGAGRMRWPRFLFWNAAGAITWATGIALAGYFLGKAASAVVGGVGLALLAVAAIVAGGALVIRRRHAHAEVG
jgi:membrane-associated protein